MCWVILLSGVLVAVLSPVSLRSLPGLPFLQLLHPQGVDRLHWVCGEKGDRAEQHHQHKTPPCSKGQTMKKERTITENTTKALPQTSKYPCFPPPLQNTSVLLHPALSSGCRDAKPSVCSAITWQMT